MVRFGSFLFSTRARQWQTKTTVANLRHEGKEIYCVYSDNMPSERAVPCEATLEDLYYLFPTEEGVK